LQAAWWLSCLPYFHNGGQLTFGDILRFYSRGGDVTPQTSLDGLIEISPLNVLENTPDRTDTSVTNMP
jgi:hypothetical protein